MLITDNKTKLNYLNNNVRFILNTKILWERRQSERPIIQCHRCQRWGHATSNCQRQPRCLKCAASHLTNECLKTRETRRLVPIAKETIRQISPNVQFMSADWSC
nr:unnamed protein product [Callosobruchus analis]